MAVVDGDDATLEGLRRREKKGEEKRRHEKEAYRLPAAHEDRCPPENKRRGPASRPALLSARRYAALTGSVASAL